MPRNYVKVAEKTKKDAKEDKSLGRISAFFSKTAANGSGVCHRLHRLPSNRFLCGEFIAGAFDSAASTEEATPAQTSAKRAASSCSQTSPKKKQVKLSTLFAASPFFSAPAESSESSRQPDAKSVSPDQDPQVPPLEETEPGHFTDPIQVESTTTESAARCIPPLSFVPQFLHNKLIRFVFSGKPSRSTDAASAVAPASSQAPSTLSQVPSSSPSDAPAQDAVPQCSRRRRRRFTWLEKCAVSSRRSLWLCAPQVDAVLPCTSWLQIAMQCSTLTWEISFGSGLASLPSRINAGWRSRSRFGSVVCVTRRHRECVIPSQLSSQFNQQQQLGTHVARIL